MSSEFDYSFDLSVGETDVSQARKKSSFNYVTVKTTEGTVFVLVKIPAFYLEHLGNDFPDLLRFVNAAAAAAVDKGF